MDEVQQLGFTVVAQRHIGCGGNVQVMRKTVDHQLVLVCSHCGKYWTTLPALAHSVESVPIGG